MHLKMSSAKAHLLHITLLTNVSVVENSVDPNQNARGAVRSGSTLFDQEAS